MDAIWKEVKNFPIFELETIYGNGTDKQTGFDY